MLVVPLLYSCLPTQSASCESEVGLMIKREEELQDMSKSALISLIKATNEELSSKENQSSEEEQSSKKGHILPLGKTPNIEDAIVNTLSLLQKAPLKETEKEKKEREEKIAYYKAQKEYYARVIKEIDENNSKNKPKFSKADLETFDRWKKVKALGACSEVISYQWENGNVVLLDAKDRYATPEPEELSADHLKKNRLLEVAHNQRTIDHIDARIDRLVTQAEIYTAVDELRKKDKSEDASIHAKQLEEELDELTEQRKALLEKNGELVESLERRFVALNAGLYALGGDLAKKDSVNDQYTQNHKEMIKETIKSSHAANVMNDVYYASLLHDAQDYMIKNEQAVQEDNSKMALPLLFGSSPVTIEQSLKIALKHVEFDEKREVAEKMSHEKLTLAQEICDEKKRKEEVDRIQKACKEEIERINAAEQQAQGYPEQIALSPEGNRIFNLLMHEQKETNEYTRSENGKWVNENRTLVKDRDEYLAKLHELDQESRTARTIGRQLASAKQQSVLAEQLAKNPDSIKSPLEVHQEVSTLRQNYDNQLDEYSQLLDAMLDQSEHTDNISCDSKEVFALLTKHSKQSGINVNKYLTQLFNAKKVKVRGKRKATSTQDNKKLKQFFRNRS